MKRSKETIEITRELRGQVLGWYDRHRRDLPWRAKEGQVPDPYHVWLSEIMLQQTTVTAVKDYYTKFLAKWPTVADLAAAGQEEIMANWAGLGYYARARNLHKCAGVVASDLGGAFPDNQADLKKLPGIGDYTSAAITAIAFNKPAPVMDGNIERVMARLFNVREALPKSKPKLKIYVEEFFDESCTRPGDLAQSLMDFGAGVCIPKAPRCSLCPLTQGCEAYKMGDPEVLPIKTKKKPRPQKHANAYWVENESGEVLLHKRPEKGMLGGMLGLPTSEWVLRAEVIEGLSWLDEVKSLDAHVDHVFTHFDMRLYPKVAHIVAPGKAPEGYAWYTLEHASSSTPSLFQKVCKICSKT